MELLRAFVTALLSRSGLLWVWILAALAALIATLYFHFEQAPIFRSLDEWLWLVAASALLWLPLLLLLLDPPDNYSVGPGPWLPLTTLLVLIGLAAFAFLDRQAGWGLIQSTYYLQVQASFFALLAVAFIPRIWSALDFAAFEAKRRADRAKLARQAYISEQMTRYPDVQLATMEDDRGDQKDATSLGALVVTFVVGAIGLLAYIAGEGTTFSIKSAFGFFLCFAVIGVFIAVVFLDAFAELDIVRSLGRASRLFARLGYPLAAFYGWVDTFLVRIGATIVGTGHRSMAMRYAVLVGTMGALCVMSLYLPPPLGLAPAFIGFALAISVSRLWNWVEDDRALAALTKYKSTAPYQTDFRENYLDETLLGFAFVFLLAPMAMMQANDGGLFGGHLFNNAETRSVADWVGFFGIELAKAIPMVDWAEVYGVETTRDVITTNGPASRHAVFLARVMVDLVLIAALLQAVGVLTRNRHQKQLYAAGHIDRLDPFLERVEFTRAMRASRLADSFELSRLKESDVVDFRRYNEEQLRTLYGSSGDASVRSFIELIARQSGMHLGNAMELTIEIAESQGNEVDLINAFSRAVQEHSQRTATMEPDDLFRILSALRSKTGLRDFKQAVVDQLEAIATPSEVIEVLSGLAEGERADQFLYARRYMAQAIVKAKARL